MQVIFGINPVLEALKGRDERVRKVVIASGRKGDAVQKIRDIAKELGIPIEFRERDYLDRLAGEKFHQGFVALCETFNYVTVDEIVANRHTDFNYNLILLLDGITDPQNLGSIIRTAHCFGANGVIIPENRSAAVTATVMKTSAGALCHTPVAMVVNLSNTLEYLKERGFWIYGTETASGKKCSALDYKGHIGLVLGSEGRGMRPLIKKKCDFFVSIPMMGRIDSLNVSVAAGIILYEIVKAWGKV